jgi:hypothetical protein
MHFGVLSFGGISAIFLVGFGFVLLAVATMVKNL